MRRRSRHRTGRSGVLIAARCAFRERGAIGDTLSEPYRMVGVEFAAFRLVGVYMPNLAAKVPYWAALITTLRAEMDEYEPSSPQPVR